MPTNTETKHARFLRLVQRRLTRAKEELRLVGQLASSNYENTPEEAQEVVRILDEDVRNIAGIFEVEYASRIGKASTQTTNGAQPISGTFKKVSTDDQILRFNSEVKFIKDDLQPELLTMVTFDTKIRDEYVFEKDDPFEKIVVTGRGGTCLEDVFEHARRNAPTAMIVFSDLEVRIPGNPGVPIIWICIGNSSIEVPYGQLINLDE